MSSVLMLLECFQDKFYYRTLNVFPSDWGKKLRSRERKIFEEKFINFDGVGKHGNLERDFQCNFFHHGKFTLVITDRAVGVQIISKKECKEHEFR